MLYYDANNEKLISNDLEPTLKNMQRCVKGDYPHDQGYIEVVHDSHLLTNNLQGVVNEYGSNLKLTPSLRFHRNGHPVPLVGNVIFIQLPDGEGNTKNPTPAQVKAVEDYLKMKAIAE